MRVDLLSNILLTVPAALFLSVLLAGLAFADETTNYRPTIAGDPLLMVQAGGRYVFRPRGADADGDTLTYEISNPPPWAFFNPRNGSLRGRPRAEDIGTYPSIVISVSDGTSRARLAPFSITVVEAPTGSATLSWIPPTTRTDGRRLRDLAGFRITYGLEPDKLTESVLIPTPSITSAVIEELSSGTWYFALTAFTKAGIESDYSSVVSKTIP
jgi:hypothetical protein